MALLDFHNPWLLVFGILGNIISITVFLIPTSTFIRIYKEKSTMGFHSLPYVIALLSSLLWMYYAFLVKNANLLITINSVGIVTETIYITVFIIYAAKKARNHALKELILSIGGFVATFLVSWFVFSGNVRISVVGWICVAFSLGVFASPLSVVLQVIRTKSVEFLPFYLSFFLALNAIMWGGYGAILKDLRIALPNVLGFMLALVQILLYIIYRKAKPVAEEGKKVPEYVVNMEAQEASNQGK
ncbi:bidirectional sugar transporter N3-like [Ipomoea triloba]|uniref:bidirectional sugar transporter N3-like n=1 Tax=Ipomoea triloba TaxID=35885 RepID=UPI00125DFA3F|nr:bidirectional sugar transporter N3-like [Ipomoea triloba]